MLRRLVSGVFCALVMATAILAQSGSQLPDIPISDPPIEWQGPLQEEEGGIGTEIPLSPYLPPCCKDVCDGFWDCAKCYNMMLLSTSWCVRWSDR